MIKTGQSLLDFIQYLPLQAIQLPRAPITNKEAQTLYSIWNGERDEYGNIVVPKGTDSNQIASLISKGMVESKPSVAAVLGGYDRSIQLTKKGREVVKNIILYTENSKFEKKSEKELDYESVYTASEAPDLISKFDKSASKVLTVTSQHLAPLHTPERQTQDIADYASDAMDEALVVIKETDTNPETTRDTAYQALRAIILRYHQQIGNE